MPHHRTLPHKLRRLGYTTGLVGLWHLGTPESNLGKKLTRQVPYLPISPHISPYLPTSPHISPYLPTSPRRAAHARPRAPHRAGLRDRRGGG